MFVVGVTGSLGSGKSAVAAMLARRGAVVIDADRIVHRLLANDRSCRRTIAKAFGSEIITSRGVDRRKLATIVFGNPRALEKLEALVHPLVWRETEAILKRVSREKIAVIDAPLLIEAGWQRHVDVIVVVKAPIATQIERIRTRMGLTPEEARQRIRRQMPLKEKLKYADFVVDNSGTKSDTYKQVMRLWKALQRSTNQEDRRS